MGGGGLGATVAADVFDSDEVVDGPPGNRRNVFINENVAAGDEGDKRFASALFVAATQIVASK